MNVDYTATNPRDASLYRDLAMRPEIKHCLYIETNFQLLIMYVQNVTVHYAVVSQKEIIFQVTLMPQIID